MLGCACMSPGRDRKTAEDAVTTDIDTPPAKNCKRGG